MNPPIRSSRWWVWCAVIVLLALHYGMAVGSKRNECTTSDEIAHLTGGYTFWLGDYRLHPENGNLPQRWAALPAWLQGAKYPSLTDNPYWATSDVWVMGHQFFYETGEDHFPRLMAGRAMIAIFGVGTGLLIFLWSQRLFGTAGGLISLGFFAFCPNFLAHDALVTSDACMVFFMLASVGAWWRHLHDGRFRWWACSAITFGMACVAKYSAPLLLPMFVALAVVRSAAAANAAAAGGGDRWKTGGKHFGHALLSLAGHGLVAVFVIWAFFGFRFSAFNPALPPAAQFIRTWAWFEPNLGHTGKLLHWISNAHLLPEAYVYGFAYVLDSAQVRAAFLNGNYSFTGWPSFFLWAALLKTTLAVLLASVVVSIATVRRWARAQVPGRWREDLYRVAPLVALFVVYWYFSITSHLNIGHRHILPTYPAVFIAAGVLGVGFTVRNWKQTGLVVFLLGWHVVASIGIAPHYIAYFNELAGGPANGRHHLVDSSLDWGQDLPGLKAWLAVNNPKNEAVTVSYFGTGEPHYYGLHIRRTAFNNGFKIATPYQKYVPGIYCVSATTLSMVYGAVQGPWTLELEKDYQQLRTAEPLFLGEKTDSATPTIKPEHIPLIAKRLDELRFTRLCHYLHVRKPDANVGYSIWIFRLSADEVARATSGSLADWSALIEETVAKK